MDRDYVLLFFGQQAGTAKRTYCKDLEEEPGTDRERELSGGGFVRSQGGWSKVRFKRKRGEKALGDERIPGGDGFVRAALKDAEERKEVLLPAEDRLHLLDEDIERARKSGKLPGMRKEIARKPSCSSTACRLPKRLANR
ncbi:MAG: hypothetical protein JW989_09075 [Chlorobiaceae bacterium]|nr:hypothetical protein [Chlorobiaceae bacterium]